MPLPGVVRVCCCSMPRLQGPKKKRAVDAAASSESFEIHDITDVEYRTVVDPAAAVDSISEPEMHLHVTWCQLEADGKHSTTIEPYSEVFARLDVVQTFLARPAVKKSMKLKRRHSLQLYNEQVLIKDYVEAHNKVI